MDVYVPTRPSRRVPAAVAALLTTAALGIGVVAGHQMPSAGQTSADPAPGQVDNGGAEVVVAVETTVVRTFTTTVGEKLTLVHVPHYVVESWGDFLVSSDPAVIEVVDDVTIRTVSSGVAELRIGTDGGTETTLYRVTVTD